MKDNYQNIINDIENPEETYVSIVWSVEHINPHFTPRDIYINSFGNPILKTYKDEVEKIYASLFVNDKQIGDTRYVTTKLSNKNENFKVYVKDIFDLTPYENCNKSIKDLFVIVEDVPTIESIEWYYPEDDCLFKDSNNIDTIILPRTYSHDIQLKYTYTNGDTSFNNFSEEYDVTDSKYFEFNNGELIKHIDSTTYSCEYAIDYLKRKENVSELFPESLKIILYVNSNIDKNIVKDYNKIFECNATKYITGFDGKSIKISDSDFFEEKIIDKDRKTIDTINRFDDIGLICVSNLLVTTSIDTRYIQFEYLDKTTNKTILQIFSKIIDLRFYFGNSVTKNSDKTKDVLEYSGLITPTIKCIETRIEAFNDEDDSFVSLMTPLFPSIEDKYYLDRITKDKCQELEILVTGYTDSNGNDPTNLTPIVFQNIDFDSEYLEVKCIPNVLGTEIKDDKSNCRFRLVPKKIGETMVTLQGFKYLNVDTTDEIVDENDFIEYKETFKVEIRQNITKMWFDKRELSIPLQNTHVNSDVDNYEEEVQKKLSINKRLIELHYEPEDATSSMLMVMSTDEDVASVVRLGHNFEITGKQKGNTDIIVAVDKYGNGVFDYDLPEAINICQKIDLPHNNVIEFKLEDTDSSLYDVKLSTKYNYELKDVLIYFVKNKDNQCFNISIPEDKESEFTENSISIKITNFYGDIVRDMPINIGFNNNANEYKKLKFDSFSGNTNENGIALLERLSMTEVNKNSAFEFDGLKISITYYDYNTKTIKYVPKFKLNHKSLYELDLLIDLSGEDGKNIIKYIAPDENPMDGLKILIEKKNQIINEDGISETVFEPYNRLNTNVYIKVNDEDGEYIYLSETSKKSEIEIFSIQTSVDQSSLSEDEIFKTNKKEKPTYSNNFMKYNPAKCAICNVNVSIIELQEIKLETNKITIDKNSKKYHEDVRVLFIPDNATFKDISFSIENKSLAKVLYIEDTESLYINCKNAEKIGDTKINIAYKYIDSVIDEDEEIEKEKKEKLQDELNLSVITHQIESITIEAENGVKDIDYEWYDQLNYNPYSNNGNKRVTGEKYDDDDFPRYYLPVNNSMKFKANIYPSTANDDNITWLSSNSELVHITQNGIATATRWGSEELDVYGDDAISQSRFPNTVWITGINKRYNKYGICQLRVTRNQITAINIDIPPEHDYDDDDITRSVEYEPDKDNLLKRIYKETWDPKSEHEFDYIINVGETIEIPVNLEVQDTNFGPSNYIHWEASKGKQHASVEIEDGSPNIDNAELDFDWSNTSPQIVNKEKLTPTLKITGLSVGDTTIHGWTFNPTQSRFYNKDNTPKQNYIKDSIGDQITIIGELNENGNLLTFKNVPVINSITGEFLLDDEDNITTTEYTVSVKYKRRNNDILKKEIQKLQKRAYQLSQTSNYTADWYEDEEGNKVFSSDAKIYDTSVGPAKEEDEKEHEYKYILFEDGDYTTSKLIKNEKYFETIGLPVNNISGKLVINKDRSESNKYKLEGIYLTLPNRTQCWIIQNKEPNYEYPVYFDVIPYIYLSEKENAKPRRSLEISVSRVGEAANSIPIIVSVPSTSKDSKSGNYTYEREIYSGETKSLSINEPIGMGLVGTGILELPKQCNEEITNDLIAINQFNEQFNTNPLDAKPGTGIWGEKIMSRDIRIRVVATPKKLTLYDIGQKDALNYSEGFPLDLFTPANNLKKRNYKIVKSNEGNYIGIGFDEDDWFKDDALWPDVKSKYKQLAEKYKAFAWFSDNEEVVKFEDVPKPIGEKNKYGLIEYKANIYKLNTNIIQETKTVYLDKYLNCMLNIEDEGIDESTLLSIAKSSNYPGYYYINKFGQPIRGSKSKYQISSKEVAKYNEANAGSIDFELQPSFIKKIISKEYGKANVYIVSPLGDVVLRCTIEIVHR